MVTEMTELQILEEFLDRNLDAMFVRDAVGVVLRSGGLKAKGHNARSALQNLYKQDRRLKADASLPD